MARTAVVAGTATAVSNRVSRRQAARWQDQEYAQAQQQPAYAPPPAAPVAVAAAAPPADDDALTAELQKLAGLHGQGILTDEEFSAAKAKLLGI
jgi:hypothetical protein